MVREEVREGSGRSPAISVLTVTNRPGGIDVTWASLKKQTFTDFEWILCDELYEWRKEEVKAYVNDTRLIHIPSPRVHEDLWNLNKSHNAALRAARGDLIVSLQDYIWIRGDGLEKFWALHTALGPRNLITGAGHKSEHPRLAHDIKGKITIFKEPFTDKPSGISERDSRLEGEMKLEETNASWWETNWAAAPRKVFYDLGGYEEQHDAEFYGCDNLTIALRAELLGYRFWLDKTNQCIGLPHSDFFPRPADWEKRHGRHGAFAAWYTKWIEDGRHPLTYLNGNKGDSASAS